jgi:anti-sigma B factor antagonist
MPVVLQNHEQSGYSVLAIEGRFNAMSVQEIRKAAEGALGLGIKNLVMDFSKTTMLDSAGIGCIIAVHKQFSASHGMLYLVSASQGITGLLKSSSLHKILSIMPSIGDAEAVLKSGLVCQERGFYVLFSLPFEFNLAIVKPFRDNLDKSRNKGYSNIVLDFERCRVITSMGIGLLVNLHKDLSAKGGGLFLLKLSPEVRAVMQSANVLSVLQSFETLGEIEDKLMPTLQ